MGRSTPPSSDPRKKQSDRLKALISICKDFLSRQIALSIFEKLQDLFREQQRSPSFFTILKKKSQAWEAPFDIDLEVEMAAERLQVTFGSEHDILPPPLEHCHANMALGLSRGRATSCLFFFAGWFFFCLFGGKNLRTRPSPYMFAARAGYTTFMVSTVSTALS